MFTDYVSSQILQASSSRAQGDRMREMLEAVYPTPDTPYGSYHYARLLHIVQYFALGKEPLESA